MREALLTGHLVQCLLMELLFPLRHLLYPGDPSWTEEGQLFTRRMMIRRKDVFKVVAEQDSLDRLHHERIERGTGEVRQATDRFAVTVIT